MTKLTCFQLDLAAEVWRAPRAGEILHLAIGF
jgi:hypothetical protein